jgi:signal transduction histidine kinase/ActR/RegA family two-component response regulator
VLKVLTCLAVDHDWRLVLVAGLVCLTATFTAFRLYGVAMRSGGALRFAWAGLTGLAAGCGIWATHFIAMLAYQPRLATGYEPVGTVLSLLLAVGATSVGFGWAARGERFRNGVIAGTLLGLGVAVMHYTGMSAFRIQGTLDWSPGHVAASVAISVLLAAAALSVAGRADQLRRQLMGAVVFTLAICGMHFTGMGALTLVPDGAMEVPHRVIDRGMMAISVTGLAVIIGLTALGAVLIEAWTQAASLARLKVTIDAMPHGVALFDAQDRLVVWNPRYLEVWNVAPGLLKPGVSFRSVLETRVAEGEVPDAVGREAEWIAERLAVRAQAPTSREQRVSGGRWVRIQEERTVDGGTVSVCIDLTDIRRDAEVLAQARDEAQAANRAKSEFLANMSHELRTPLNGVVGMADLLSRARLGARERKMVEIIRASGASLERLLSDLLDLARVEAGRVAIESAPFQPGEAVRAVTSLCALKAQEKGVDLRVEIAPEFEGAFLGDVDRLKQILANLVSNAVKFTEAGEILVRAEPAANGLRLSVSDTGVGFDPADRDRIFGRFEQADASITRRFGGSGLGLFISRQLAELMGGTLEAEGRPGEGSTFILTLPLSPAEAVYQPDDRSSPAAETDGRPLRVLVADDHPINRTVVEMILAEAGVELTAVEDGAQALEAFKAGGFDVVLMDMMMPVMDGLSATRAIRDYERAHGLAPTPVIMLTANALPEHLEQSLAAGAQQRVTKPIDAAALLSAISELTAPPAAAAEPRRRRA